MASMGKLDKEVVAQNPKLHHDEDSPTSVGSQSEDGGKQDVIIETGKVNENSKEDEAKDKGGFGPYIKLWRYGTPIDTVLRCCGFFAAIAAGTVCYVFKSDPELLRLRISGLKNIAVGWIQALPLMTIVFGKLINNFNEFQQGSTSSAELRSAISRNSLYFVYLFIAKAGLVYVHTTCFTITAIRSVRRLRLAYVKSILRQDMSYFDSYTPGSVATRISNNANLIQAGLSEKVGTAVQGFSMLIASFVVAFTQNWRLTLPVATTVPTAVILVGITVMMDAKLEAKILDIYAKAGGLVEEALGSIRIVCAFGAHKKLVRKYDEHLNAAKAFGVKKGPVLGIQYSSEFFIMYCAYALAFWYGIKLLLRDQIESGGTILTVLFSVVIGTSSMTMIAPSLGEFSKSGAAANDVLKMIDREPEIDSSSNEGSKKETVHGDLELSGVSFAYPARPTIEVLHNFNLKFQARKVTALVGSSGSGKSTVIAMLERWYDPAQGRVSLDGENIKDLNVKWLRSQIGLVQQEPILFNDTIYKNVVYGLHGTKMDGFTYGKKRELVREACIEANADEFIQNNFPKGYDTKVGERGSLLSGGQRQRVAIARSIISNPRILLLDEATSALDPKSEGIVQAALDTVSRTRTTVLIAHKLSTVKKANTIVVMNKGRVVEQGTHQSLLEARGSYWHLVNAQNLTSAADEEDIIEDGKSTGAAHAPEFEKVQNAKSMHSDVPSEIQTETENITRKMSLFRCLLIIFYEQRLLWYLFTCGGIAAVLGGAVFPAQAVLFSKVITVFQLPRSQLQDRGNFWSLMFFILALGTLLSYASIGFFLTVAAFITSRFYRSEYFSAILSMDIEWFDLPDNSSGNLTARLSTDPQHLQDLISSNLGLILIVIVNLIASCSLALAVGWKLSLVAIFGCLPALFLAGFTRMRMEMKSQDRNAKLYLESARFASEAVGAIRTVSSLTLESKVYDNYAERLEGPVARSYRHTMISMIFFGLSESIDMAAMALAFWYGGRLLSEGKYNSQQFFIIFVAIIFGGQAAGFLFGYTLNTTKAHAAANQILHLRGQKAPINHSSGAPLPPYSTDIAIEFKNVTFHYPTRPNHPVLRNLNLRIYRGQSIGLVGPSGCGKTTIIALLERFYDISSGEILIYGQSLSSLDVASYRASTGLVSQETTLYQGSIRENVTLGVSHDISDEAVIKACQDANIHDFIMSLPDGYATDCGSRGQAFSGGQRQRLATARALLRDPPLLLLDEATSALDTESERIVQAALENAARGRTTIAVAHRLSTVQDADQLFVLDGGRIMENGTHGELLKQRGRYYEMCQAQSLDRDVKA